MADIYNKEIALSTYDLIDLNYIEIDAALGDIYTTHTSFIPEHLKVSSIFQCWTEDEDKVKASYESYCLAQTILCVSTQTDITKFQLKSSDSLLEMKWLSEEATEFIMGNKNVSQLASKWLPKINPEFKYSKITSTILGVILMDYDAS